MIEKIATIFDDVWTLKGETYAVKRTRQTEVEDHFKVVNIQTGETFYEKFPRTMEQTLDNVLSYYE